MLGKKYIFVWLAIIITINAKGQIRFKHFGTEEGLSQTTVNSFIQDRKGYMWIATQDGLNRFDGKNFVKYRNNLKDTNSLSDNFVVELALDTAGNIIACCRHGMSEYNKQASFKNYYFDEKGRKSFHNRIEKIWQLQNGYVVKFNDQYAYCSHFSFSNYKLIDDGKRKCFFRFYKNGAIITVFENYFVIHDIVSNKTETYSHHLNIASGFTNNFCLDSNLEIITGKLNLIYNSRTKSFSNCELQLPQSINSIFRVKSAKIWIGTNDGLYLNENGILKHIIVTDISKHVSSINISAVYESNNGMIWVGTRDAGFFTYNPNTEIFNPNYGIKNLNGIGVINGSIVGCANGKLVSFSSKTNKVETTLNYINEFKNDIVTFCQDKEGRIWTGTRNDGLYIYDKSTNTVEHKINLTHNNKSSSKIFDIICDQKHKIWVASEYGLYTFDNGLCEQGSILQGGILVYCSNLIRSFLPTNSKISHSYIIHLMEDKAGNMWVSTATGLNRIDAKTNEIKTFYHNPDDPNSIPHNIILTTYEDRNGNIWIGTKGGGMGKMNPLNFKCENYSTNEGLPNDYVHGILEDVNGKLWCSTGEGLAVYNPATKKITSYYKNIGLPGNEFETNSFYKTNTGDLLFAGPEGYCFFNPKQTEKYIFHSKLYLDNLTINYKPRDYENGQTLQLDYNDKVLHITPQILDFIDPEHHSIRYKLEGFDTNWIYINNENKIISYTNLPFGNLKLIVQSKHSSEEEYSATQTLNIYVSPPFWKTNLFLFLMIISGIGITYLITRYYSQRKLKKQLREVELKQKIQNERERISRDLHDNIGANITYMISSLDHIQYKSHKKNDDETAYQADKLSDFARNTMQQLRESIWAINSETITLSEWVEKVNEYMATMLENRDEQYHIKNSIELDCNMHPNIAINLYRMVQEIVNNALKHAQSKNIFIQIHQEKNLIIEISDDGIGYDSNEKFEGHYGLKNLHERAKEINASMKTRSAIAKGTKYTITLE